MTSIILILLSVLAVEDTPGFALTGDETLEELFVMASSSELQYEEMRQPARDQIVEMGTEAVPFLVEKLGTTDARERHALEYLLENIGSGAVPIMLDMLEKEDDKHALRLGMRCFGLIGDSAALRFLGTHSQSDDWKVRSSACFGLGRMKDTRATLYLEARLSDDNELVRKSAAVGLGDNEDPAALNDLVGALEDPYYAVRYSALYSIQDFGKEAVGHLEGVLVNAGSNEMVTRLAVEGLGEIGAELAAEDQAREVERIAAVVRLFLDSGSWSVRAAAVVALSKTTDDESWLSELVRKETHPLVLGKIEQVLVEHE